VSDRPPTDSGENVARDAKVCPEVPLEATCASCGYCLRGLASHICPECGTPFDPADPLTFVSPTNSHGWQRLAAPPRRWHVIGVCACALAGVYVFSDPLGSVLACVAVPFAAVLLVDYLVRVLAVLLVRLQGGGRRTPAYGSRVRRLGSWLATPLCFAILSSMPTTSWPFKARFAISRAALENTASEMKAADLHAAGARRIGLFRVRRIVEIEPGLLFFELDDVAERAGFVLRSEGPPAHGRYYRDLGHAWYLEWPRDY
jgi:hypothetical protein